MGGNLLQARDPLGLNMFMLPGGSPSPQTQSQEIYAHFLGDQMNQPVTTPEEKAFRVGQQDAIGAYIDFLTAQWGNEQSPAHALDSLFGSRDKDLGPNISYDEGSDTYAAPDLTEAHSAGSARQGPETSGAWNEGFMSVVRELMSDWGDPSPTFDRSTLSLRRSGYAGGLPEPETRFGIVMPVGGWRSRPVRAGEAGSFSDLTARRVSGDDLTPHHMPQAAMRFTSYESGGALVVTTSEHQLLRTTGARGRVTLRQEAGLPFRDVLARDIRDVRSNLGPKYDPGIRSLLRYYREHHPELMRRP